MKIIPAGVLGALRDCLPLVRKPEASKPEMVDPRRAFEVGDWPVPRAMRQAAEKEATDRALAECLKPTTAQPSNVYADERAMQPNPNPVVISSAAPSWQPKKGELAEFTDHLTGEWQKAVFDEYDADYSCPYFVHYEDAFTCFRYCRPLAPPARAESEWMTGKPERDDLYFVVWPVGSGGYNKWEGEWLQGMVSIEGTIYSRRQRVADYYSTPPSKWRELTPTERAEYERLAAERVSE